MRPSQLCLLDANRIFFPSGVNVGAKLAQPKFVRVFGLRPSLSAIISSIFIGVVTEGHWQSFCREFGLQEFSDDPTLRNTTDRILARGRIIPRVAMLAGWCELV
jgi:hypothetical protein